MNEVTLMVPFRGTRYYYDVVTLAGVTYEAFGSRVLVGDAFVYDKGAEFPILTWELFVREDAELYERGDALWWQLCNVAKTEAISLIYREHQKNHREQIERRNREAAISRPEIRAQRGKNFYVPRLSILRNEKKGNVVPVKSESPLRLLTAGSRTAPKGVRLSLPAFRILPPPARLSVQRRPSPQA